MAKWFAGDWMRFASIIELRRSQAVRAAQVDKDASWKMRCARTALK